MQPVINKTYLLSEDDDKTFENANEINEEIQWVGDKIFITIQAFLNDQLSVIEDKSTHNYQSQIQIGLEYEAWAQEQVC